MNIFKGSKRLEFSDRFKTDRDCKEYLADIRAQSPTMVTMETKGKLKIVGAVYDMETGKVNFAK